MAGGEQPDAWDAAVSAARSPRPARRVLTVLAGVVLTLLLGVLTAVPANAHATLLFADPAIGGATPAGPPALTLIFDEPVTVSGPAVRLSSGSGAAAQVGPTRLTSAGRVLTVGLPSRLAPGAYQVRWQVLAGDGDVVGGSYSFLVGPPTTLGAPPPTGSQPSSPSLAGSVVLRWLLFTALSLALGGAVGAALSHRLASAVADLPRPPTTAASAVGAVAALGLAVLNIGNGSISRALSDPAWSALTDARPGRLVLVELAAFVSSAALSATGRHRWVPGPLLAVVAAEAIRAHPAVAVPGWGAVLTATHLGATAVWVGALAHAVRTAIARRASPSAARAVLVAYAPLAAWLFAVVIVTGTISAVLLVPPSGWTGTAYGRTLLVKLALVAVAAGLAILSRRRLRRRTNVEPVSTTTPARHETPAGWAVRSECAVLGVVLGVTGLLVSLPTPRALGATWLPLPPPPRGIALPVGGRAGQVGVSATASAGQLVIRLSAPSLGNLADDIDRNHYDVSAATIIAATRSTAFLSNVAQPGPGGPRPLQFQRCGAGCFVAPATWGKGLNVVTLRVGSKGWTGGSLTLRVLWPVAPGDQRLRAVATAMRSVPRFTLYEQVSSDLSADNARPTALRMSGATFLATEPWGSGAATQSALIQDHPGFPPMLAVGFPADKTQAELVIGPDGRIQRETLTAPGHIITRTFAYPAHAGS